MAKPLLFRYFPTDFNQISRADKGGVAGYEHENSVKIGW